MMLNSGIVAASADFLDPDTVFSADLWTGNAAVRSIVTGLDMIANTGLVWIKSRSVVQSHNLFSTLRGASRVLKTDSTAAEVVTAASLTTFNANGFNLSNDVGVNQSGANYVGLTFIKAPKFFDVVAWTGNGVTNRKIPHALGVAPGLIIIKARNTIAAWVAYSSAAPGKVNNPWGATAFVADTTVFVNGSSPVAPTSIEFTVGTNVTNNASSVTYEAYLFAHDPSGIIQCDVATPDVPFNLGWAPQFIMAKDVNSTSVYYMFDTARGMGAGNDPVLQATSTATETAGDFLSTSGSGFTLNSATMSTNPFSFVAIRAP